MKNTKSHSKPFTEPAKGKDNFNLKLSWFDIPSNNAGCLEVKNFPVTAKDLKARQNEKNTPSVQPQGVPSNNTTDSSGNKVNPFSKRASGITNTHPCCQLCSRESIFLPKPITSYFGKHCSKWISSSFRYPEDQSTLLS